MYHAIFVRSKNQDQQSRVQQLTRDIFDVVHDPEQPEDSQSINSACVSTGIWSAISNVVPYDMEKPSVLSIGRDEVRSLFTMSGFVVEEIHQLSNQYWGTSIETMQYGLAAPWWLVQTTLGNIRVGPRKRVFVLDWSPTGIEIDPKDIVGDDDVTKGVTSVHAWGAPKLMEYISNLHTQLRKRELLKQEPVEQA